MMWLRFREAAWLAVAKASAAGTVVLRKQDLQAYGDAEGKTLILVEDAPLRWTLELFAPEGRCPCLWCSPFCRSRSQCLCGPRCLYWPVCSGWARGMFGRRGHS